MCIRIFFACFSQFSQNIQLSLMCIRIFFAGFSQLSQNIQLSLMCIRIFFACFSQFSQNIQLSLMCIRIFFAGFSQLSQDIQLSLIKGSFYELWLMCTRCLQVSVNFPRTYSCRLSRGVSSSCGWPTCLLWSPQRTTPSPLRMVPTSRANT